MERVNLVVAISLIISGTVLLVIAVSPFQMECFLTTDACYALYVQDARDLFVSYFIMGAALLIVAIFVLYRGRSMEDKPTILPSKAGRKLSSVRSE
jgi:hypothetical protein